MKRVIKLWVDDDSTRMSSIMEQLGDLIQGDRYMRGVTIGAEYIEDGQGVRWTPPSRRTTSLY